MGEDVTVSRKQRRSSHTRQKERRAKWQKIRARIPECMKKFKDLREEHTRADMYTFVRSVAQMYDRLNPQSGAELHVDRRSITSSAVTAVFSEGRADELPFDGDADVAVRVLMPVLELLFEMPVLRPMRNSKEWEAYMCKHLQECNFEDLCENARLSKAYFKYHVNRFGDNNRPRLYSTDVLFWKTYTPEKKKAEAMRSPRTVTPHNYFRFLRGVSHNYAINASRNLGCFPVTVAADDEDNLSDRIFCNHTKVLLTYYIHYCYAEGLHPSSQTAREVLVYLFYAKPLYQGKEVSCIRIIHRCMQSGTYRFPETETLFKEVLKLMRENPCILHWLADKGDNNIDSSTLYVRFKHALETGMRRLALSGSRLFRVRDMQSEQAWMNVDLWRKHRCVLFLVRYVNKEENYAPYHDFRFKDYVQRTQIIKTYNVRFSDLHTAVAFDKDWVTAQLSDTEEEVPDPVSVKRKTKRVWDSDEEEWVHEDDTGIVDGDTPGASRSAKKTTVTPKSPRTPVMASVMSPTRHWKNRKRKAFRTKEIADKLLYDRPRKRKKAEKKKAEKKQKKTPSKAKKKQVLRRKKK